MPESTLFKRRYTQEELREISEWFKTHEAELPDTLQLDKATYYKSLKSALTVHLEGARLYGDNPTFSGQLHQLFLIRKKLISEQLVSAN